MAKCDGVLLRSLRRAGEREVRRLPVADRDKRLVGIVALATLPSGVGRSGRLPKCFLKFWSPLVHFADNLEPS